jgi:hypothetical protein
MKKLFFTFLMIGLSQLISHANNVAISGLTYLSGSDQIRFNITWDNSWRNTSTSGSTQNYDGVWVFAKFRHACAKDSIWPSASDYTHMWLSTTTSDHSVPSGAELQVGSTNFSGIDRGMGVFIYRNSDGTGTANFSNVTLKWAKAAQGIIGTDWDIQLFAIEMVNIPSAPFGLGDGYSSSSYGGGTLNYYEFTAGSSNDPYLVNSEDAISMGTSTTQLYQRSGSSSGSYMSPYSGSATIGANTPKGFNAFWCMKYEVTQKQFVDFLNTLSRTNQKFMVRNQNLVNQFGLGDTSVNDALISNDEYNLGFFWDSWSQQRSYGNGIAVAYTGGISATNKIVPGAKPWTFACDLNNNGVFNESADGLNTACNFLSAKLLWAYLDWAALQPMNELEFEKVCRGPSTVSPFIPQVDAFVWGTYGISGNYTFTNGGWSSPRTSSESPTAATTSTGLVIANESAGPRRVGSTNRSSTTRIQSGSSYYGVANMAGNVEEIVVRFSSNASGSSSCIDYNRTAYGDGNINTIISRSYLCDLDRWPLEFFCGSGNGSLGTRGGSWATNDPSFFGISNRYYTGGCPSGSFTFAWSGNSYGSPDGGGDGRSLDYLYFTNRVYNGSVMQYLANLGGRGVR